MLKKYEKLICLIIVIGMFFTGMCLEMVQADSSFLCAKNIDAADEFIEAESLVMEDMAVFTLNMIHNSTATICRGLEHSSLRWYGSAAVLFSIVGMFLHYLFYYQSCECKEDGQLLLNRSIAVKYIHQKDGGK